MRVSSSSRRLTFRSPQIHRSASKIEGRAPACTADGRLVLPGGPKHHIETVRSDSASLLARGYPCALRDSGMRIPRDGVRSAHQLTADGDARISPARIVSARR
jgi:hypothetical protein